MTAIEVTAKTVTADDIEIVHSGKCLNDQHTREVCEGIYIDMLNDNLELCAALRAVYAIAGEDPQVRKIVEEALEQHGA